MATLCTQCRCTIEAYQWPKCPRCGYIHEVPIPIVEKSRDGSVRMKTGDYRTGILFRVCIVAGKRGIAVWDRVTRSERFLDKETLDTLVNN